MTEQALVALVSCICSAFPAKADKLVCFEKFTNCAVVQDGKILDLKQFMVRCEFVKGQKRCYNE